MGNVFGKNDMDSISQVLSFWNLSSSLEEPSQMIWWMGIWVFFRKAVQLI